jgi:hypothetical protein
MGDIINLRRARKTQARKEAEQRAQQNRLTFGRSKSEKALTKARAEHDSARLDQHQREISDNAGDETQHS